jgi:hypothetical protein
VGGILGLCVGVSLISGIEIVYWVVVGFVEKSLLKSIAASRKTSRQEPILQNAASAENFYG